jgi:predicted metal-dependent hydrolase
MAGVAERQVHWGARVLAFTLHRAARTRLRIAVRPDGGIEVFAPDYAVEADVLERVRRRGDWIVRQLDRFAQWRPRTPTRQYVSGETHLFLGRQLRLRIVEGANAAPHIAGDRLVVPMPKGTARDEIRASVDVWYNCQARRVLHEQYRQQHARWASLGIEQPPRLIVRSLRSRWGSLTAAGNLVLNRDLVFASPRLIDYVIAHELGHVLHPDHGRDWQRFMSRVMPDWRERKNALEQQLL